MLCHIARSRQLVAAAYVVTLAWCLTFFWHDYFHGTRITWGYAVIDACAFCFFRRQARISTLATPLVYVHFACVVLYFFATTFNIADWWVMAIGNRLFETEILYLIGCALYRIIRLREKEKGAPAARPTSPA